VEDRALLGSNPSAAMVQGHRRCPVGIAFSSYYASGLKRKISGVWGQSSQKIDDYCAAGRLVNVKTDLVALRMLMRRDSSTGESN